MFQKLNPEELRYSLVSSFEEDVLERLIRGLHEVNRVSNMLVFKSVTQVHLFQ